MMNSMMRNMMGGMLDPFDLMTPASALALTPPGYSQSIHHHQHRALPSTVQSMSMHSTPYSGFSSFSSSVVTMTSDGRGQPLVYEETSSSTIAPGGVRETKRTVRDSWTGRQEMQVGHHIQDKAHLVKKSRNAYTGQLEEEEDFVNVEEDDVDRFEQEWQQRARGGRTGRYLSLQGSQPASSSSGVTIEEVEDDEAPPQRLALPAPPSATAGPSTSHRYDDTNSHRYDETNHRRSSSRDRKSYKRDKKPYSRKGHRDSK